MRPDRKLIAEILRTANQMTTARNALLAGWGLTSARLRLLKMVRRLPIPFTVSGLARAMSVSRQAVQPTVRELEAAGLVCLDVSLRNRKALVVTLTAAGRERLAQVAQVEQRWIADLTRGFSDYETARTAWFVGILRKRLGE